MPVTLKIEELREKMRRGELRPMTFGSETPRQKVLRKLEEDLRKDTN